MEINHSKEDGSKENQKVTDVLLGPKDGQVIWLIKQFQLLSKLSINRNYQWLMYLEEVLQPEFLSAAIWDSQYKMLREPFFNLLINIYIDKFPLVEVIFPQKIQVIDNTMDREDFNIDKLTRKRILGDNLLQRAMFKPLIENLNTKIKIESSKIITDINKILRRKKAKQSINEALENNMDSMMYFQGLFKLVDLLIKFNVYNIFDQESSLSLIVSSSLKLLDFSSNYLEFIPLLSELRIENQNKSKASFSVLTTPQSYKEDPPKSQKGISYETEDTEHPLIKNFFYIKNKLSKAYHDTVTNESPAIISLKLKILNIYSKISDRRHSFLIDNYCGWIQQTADHFHDEEYSENIESQIMNMIEKEMPKVIPEIMKTGFQYIDINSVKNNNFTRFCASSTPEIYDFDYLLLHKPSHETSKSYQQYGVLLPSILSMILVSQNKQVEEDSISFLLRNFNQRYELYKNLESTYIINGDMGIDSFTKMNEFVASFEETSSWINVRFIIFLSYILGVV